MTAPQATPAAEGVGEAPPLSGFTQPDAGHATLTGKAATLAAHMVKVITDAAAGDDRSRQTHIGPSEIGHPCARRLAYRMLDHPKTNTGTDPWASVVGTAVHSWLAYALQQTNDDQRYLIEARVDTGTTRGTADLFIRSFDRLTGMVVDHKVPGATALTRYRKHGPGEQYRTQLHTYAYGLERAGHSVTDVAIVFYPRAGFLSGLHVWCEPFDPTVAVAAADRLVAITTLVAQLNVEDHPEMWQHIPVTPSHCEWCPWYVPGSVDPSAGCPGGVT